MTFRNTGFGEMPSSRLDSHQNSVQNGMVERFAAFTATIFMPTFSFYVAATFCPLDGNCKSVQKAKQLREAGQVKKGNSFLGQAVAGHGCWPFTAHTHDNRS